MAKQISASIIGGSGYTGGEIIRILLGHPNVNVQQVTSESNVGKYVHQLHPNLRGQQLIQFTSASTLQKCDVLFLCMPHGKAQERIEEFKKSAKKIIDLSADFRLRDPEQYKAYYGEEHKCPDMLAEFVYGLPELHREEIKKASYVSGVGCNATAMNLPLYPLFKRGLVDEVVAEVKVGACEAGNKHNPGSHYPERAGAVRSFAPTGHRHVSEMVQELPGGEGNTMPDIHFSVTSISMVRGILGTAHVFLNKPLTEIEVRKIYREEYKDEPFIRIVKEKSGIYRYPEPKILSGTNYCDIGFEVDADSNRVVIISAIDNMMKGAAGSAIQCMNLMCGFNETTGLEFPGLHPI